jgi:nucleotide-binding universal stress UspA family protein
MFRNILVPVDGSPRSRRASLNAVRFAKEQSARITGIYVAPPYRPNVNEASIRRDFVPPHEYERRVKATADRVLRPLRKAASVAGVRCEALSAVGDYPYEEIVKAAQGRKCDLIYMASHGRRGLSLLILGSETNKVLSHCKVPVLVERV